MIIFFLLLLLFIFDVLFSLSLSLSLLSRLVFSAGLLQIVPAPELNDKFMIKKKQFLMSLKNGAAWPTLSAMLLYK